MSDRLEPRGSKKEAETRVDRELVTVGLAAALLVFGKDARDPLNCFFLAEQFIALAEARYGTLDLLTPPKPKEGP